MDKIYALHTHTPRPPPTHTHEMLFHRWLYDTHTRSNLFLHQVPSVRDHLVVVLYQRDGPYRWFTFSRLKSVSKGDIKLACVLSSQEMLCWCIKLLYYLITYMVINYFCLLHLIFIPHESLNDCSLVPWCHRKLNLKIVNCCLSTDMHTDIHTKMSELLILTV